MTNAISGLHHVSATVDEAQENVDFYAGLLGLRLVKQTVNFDDTGVYHFYYGNAEGAPGTIMTAFPYAGEGVRVGTKGTGQVTVTAFSVPREATDFWRARLAEHGVEVQTRGRRFSEEVIGFQDPSGLDLELIAAEADPRRPWTAACVSADYALRGVHSVTLALKDVGPTRDLLHDVLGLTIEGEEGDRLRLGVSGGGPGRVLDLLAMPDADIGRSGIGTVHHVALAVANEAEQLRYQEVLRDRGLSVTDVKDRTYFRSIYFREPGGVLLELATEGPGFLVDEDDATLGRSLKLPAWEERWRDELERRLPKVQLPGTDRD